MATVGVLSVTVGIDGVHSDSLTVLGPYCCEFAKWSLSEHVRWRRARDCFLWSGLCTLWSVAVTVLMTSWSSFGLSKRLFHYSCLALTTLRAEVMLELFAKVNDDPNWFPAKHTGT